MRKEKTMDISVKDGVVTIDGVEYVRKGPVGLSNIVLVRTYSAGVHFGTVKHKEGKETILTNARRLWSWSGACSLHQVAVDGVDIANSKISVKVPEIELTETIERIPMLAVAAKILVEAPEWKK